MTSFGVLGPFALGPLGPLGLALAGLLGSRFGVDTQLVFGSVWQLAAGAVVLGIPAVRNRRWEEGSEY